MVKCWAWTVLLLQCVLAVTVLSQELSLDDALDGLPGHLTTKPQVNVPKTTKPPVKPGGFDLADALDSNNDKPGKHNSKQDGGELSDDDLFDVSKDKTYNPDKGKGDQPYDSGQSDNQVDAMPEIGTIGGIVSAVAITLVGAITSYISYQKKKLCFGIQESLNADVIKSEIPEAVVAAEPQVQQTLLEKPNEDNPV